MTPEEQDCYDALREDNDCLKQENDALAARLAEAQDNWWKHPKAQIEIGGRARLRLELSHIEAIAGPTPRDELGIDDDYWSGLCDKVLKMRNELAEALGLLREARKQLGWYWAQCLYDGYSPLEDRLSVNMADIDAFLVKHKEQP